MIRILKEADESIENLTDEQIEELYIAQKSRIMTKVESIIDILLEKLPKYKEAIVKEILRDYIPNYFFDKNDKLIVVDKDNDFEDRIDEINSIKYLQNKDDEVIESEIEEIIEKIIVGE